MSAWTMNNGATELVWSDMTAYRAPGGEVPELFRRLLDTDGGVLIAGTTGAGKSAMLHGIVTSILRDFRPASAGGDKSCDLYFCDPKIVELACYEGIPHCAGYAADYDEIVELLEDVCALMRERYESMRARGLRKWDGSKVFVFIDEIGDLMIMRKKEVLPVLSHLLNQCRAAGITVFCCTQSPSRSTICASIDVNATCKIALRCSTAIESRQVVGIAGAEKLPKHGKALIKCDWLEGIGEVDVPYIDEREQELTRRAVRLAEVACIRRKAV